MTFVKATFSLVLNGKQQTILLKAPMISLVIFALQILKIIYLFVGLTCKVGGGVYIVQVIIYSRTFFVLLCRWKKADAC